MRILFATWDGAGNLPPEIALLEALAARGHETLVLAHASQRQAVETAGATYIGYESAPDFDHSVLMEDWFGWFERFNDLAVHDFDREWRRVSPDVALIDCMMPNVLSAGRTAGYKTVAIVHCAYSVLKPWHEPIEQADLALCCSYPEFDSPPKLPGNAFTVGPLRPRAQAVAWERRSPGRPLVAASLSSGIQLSTQPNLLQRICDALGRLNVEAVVMTGRGIPPDSLQAAANTTVARSIPHEHVLGSADVFVTHAGHGSVMAGISAAVPMLCLPGVGDQPMNAQRVQALGIGRALGLDATSDTILESIQELLADQEIRNRAAEFSASVVFPPRLDGAIDALEALTRN